MPPQLIGHNKIFLGSVNPLAWQVTLAQVQNCIPDAWLFMLDFFRPTNDSEKSPKEARF